MVMKITGGVKVSDACLLAITEEAKIQHSWSSTSFTGCLHMFMMFSLQADLLHMLEHVRHGVSVRTASSHEDILAEMCMVSQTEVKLLCDPSRDL